MTLLTVEGLRILGPDGHPLVHEFDLDVDAGEIVGIVGESGSGKTMTALSLLGLLPDGVRAVAGAADLDGLQFMTDGVVRARPDITMIFQNPRAALNPLARIGSQLTRLLKFLAKTRGFDTPDFQRAVAELLEAVGIEDTKRVARAFPHELSGGMNQRVMIAMALAAQPKLLVADEPTTGLDVTIQAQILQLLRDTVERTGVGVLLVSHDLGVIAQMCNRVAVMYEGQRREFAGTDELFHAPQDTYSKNLVAPDAKDLDLARRGSETVLFEPAKGVFSRGPRT